MSRAYADFLAAKAIGDPMTGIADVPELPACLFPHRACSHCGAYETSRNADACTRPTCPLKAAP